MTTIDVYADDFPHGTRVGFASGCKTKAMCANTGTNAQTCKEANMRYGRDWPYDQLIKDGLTELEADAKLRAAAADPTGPKAKRAAAKTAEFDKLLENPAIRAAAEPKPRVIPKPTSSKAQLAASVTPVPYPEEIEETMPTTTAPEQSDPTEEPIGPTPVSTGSLTIAGTTVVEHLHTDGEPGDDHPPYVQTLDEANLAPDTEDGHFGSYSVDRTIDEADRAITTHHITQSPGMTAEDVAEVARRHLSTRFKAEPAATSPADSLLTIDPTDAGGITVAFSGVGGRDVSITLVFADHGLQDVDVRVSK